MSDESIETCVSYYKFEFRAIVFGFKRNLYVEINKCLLLSLMHGIRLNIVRTSVRLEPYLVFLTVRTLYCNVAMTQ